MACCINTQQEDVQSSLTCITQANKGSTWDFYSFCWLREQQKHMGGGTARGKMNDMKLNINSSGSQKWDPFVELGFIPGAPVETIFICLGLLLCFFFTTILCEFAQLGENLESEISFFHPSVEITEIPESREIKALQVSTKEQPGPFYTPCPAQAPRTAAGLGHSGQTGISKTPPAFCFSLFSL